MEKKKKKQKKSMKIPKSLARLLTTEKRDLKNPEDYETIQKLSKAMLKVLVAVDK